MNLKDKLYQLDKSVVKKAMPEIRPKGPGIEQFVRGEFHESPFGHCFVRKEVYATNHFSEKNDFFSLLQKPSHPFHLVGKDETLHKLDIRKSLFLDTETTGLAGGAGTYAFLVGIGFFSGDEFHVEQYFMRDYHEERALLHGLLPRIEAAESFVTYNGKSYDIPLLKTRFALSKLDTDNFPALHLDLLHASRRLWRYEMETFDLNSVEYKILNVVREEDVPGALIPHLFFEYLQTRNAKPLRGVFEHNLQDILSLAGITARAAALFEATPAGSSTIGELVSIARTYEDLKLFRESANTYEIVRERITDPRWANEIATRLSWCYKRLCEWDKAKTVWEQMLSNGKKTIFPYVELAKYYEHIARDFPLALKQVQQALNWLELRELTRADKEHAEIRKDLTRRMRRIRGKIVVRQSGDIKEEENYLSEETTANN